MRTGGIRATLQAAFPVAAFLAFSALPMRASVRRAPELRLKNLQGQAQRLSDLRGHIIVVNFWATWCGPCQAELPRLSQLAQQWPGKGVRFVAVSIDDRKDQPKIGPMLEKLHVVESQDFSVWVGSNTEALADFGLGEIVPGTVVVDPDGRIVSRIMGEAKDGDVRNAVDWLVNGRKGNPPPPVVKRY